MGSSFLITNSCLKKNARNLMLEFFNIIHDDFMLNFDIVKTQRNFYDDNILSEYKNIILKDNKIFKNSNGSFFITDSEHTFLSDGVELDNEELLKYIEDEIKNKTIEVNFVYEFFNKIDKLDLPLESQINEDLYFLRKAFLKAYELLHFSGYNLED